MTPQSGFQAPDGQSFSAKHLAMSGNEKIHGATKR
jgi:hypothetical protein